MSPAAVVEAPVSDALSLEGDAIVFTSVPCLLTADELADKCDEQFEVIWNGLNR